MTGNSPSSPPASNEKEVKESFLVAKNKARL